MIGCYFRAGAPEKAVELGTKLGNDLLASAAFYLEFYDYASQDFETVCQFIYYLVDELEKGGDKKVSKNLQDSLLAMLKAASGGMEPEE